MTYFKYELVKLIKTQLEGVKNLKDTPRKGKNN